MNDQLAARLDTLVRLVHNIEATTVGKARIRVSKIDLYSDLIDAENPMRSKTREEARVIVTITMQQ